MKGMFIFALLMLIAVFAFADFPPAKAVRKPKPPPEDAGPLAIRAKRERCKNNHHDDAGHSMLQFYADHESKTGYSAKCQNCKYRIDATPPDEVKELLDSGEAGVVSLWPRLDTK